MYSIWSFLLQNEVECMPSSVHVLTAKTHPLERPCLPRYTRLFSSGTCQKQNWISSPYVALSGEGKHGASLLSQYSAIFFTYTSLKLGCCSPTFGCNYFCCCRFGLSGYVGFYYGCTFARILLRIVAVILRQTPKHKFKTHADMAPPCHFPPLGHPRMVQASLGQVAKEFSSRFPSSLSCVCHVIYVDTCRHKISWICLSCS